MDYWTFLDGIRANGYNLTNKTKLVSFIEKRNTITLRYDTINIKATNSKDFVKIKVTTFDKGVVEYGGK